MEMITFIPLYKERVWGGRELETKYGRSLPQPDRPYGESWEMVDRSDEQSLVNAGKFKGKTLGELWQNHRDEIFGTGFETYERFPLLIKILDARDKLSVQVHPPAEIAPQLGGEPKTEMWYIADALPGAKLYVGVKDGVTREDFKKAIQDGVVDTLVHAIEPRVGESIFIPSGRLHAIGAGFLIYEIQQNSDTTYRVFDWNRVGLDGKPRELHIEESMSCIDFTDVTPAMDQARGNRLADCPYFAVDQVEVKAGEHIVNPDPERFSIITVVSGEVKSQDGRLHHPGDFLLVPRGSASLLATKDSLLLQTSIPKSV